MDTPAETKNSSNVGIAVAIVLAGAIVGAALYFRPDGGSSVATGSPVPAGQVAGEQRVNIAVEADDPVLGAADAPVTIVEFSDLECPYCQRHHQLTFPQLKQQYIDTGKVRYVFKHFPLIQIHPHARPAAEISQCANAQGKFWEFADKAFANQKALTDPDLQRYATEVGVDAATLQDCLANATTAQIVSADQQAGVAAGVTGTPGFFINGQRLEGAQPFETFKAVIEAELAKK